MINHPVLLFAQIKEAAGSDTIDIALHEGATVADLRTALACRLPESASLIAQSMIAINETYASEQTLVPPRAEIACIPPVSGG